jgi:hypothetical protein
VAREIKTPWIKSKLACACKSVASQPINKNTLDIIDDIVSLAKGLMPTFYYNRRRWINIYDGKQNLILAVRRFDTVLCEIDFDGQKYMCTFSKFKQKLYSFTISNSTFDKFSKIDFPIMAI